MLNKGKSFSLFTAIVLLPCLLVASCGQGRTPRLHPAATVVTPPVAPRRTLAPLPVRALSPRLEAVRARASADASSVRGLDWKEAVGMTELSGWEYGTRTKELAEVLGGEDLTALNALAIAGGILPEGTDLKTLAVSFTAATAGATYSPLDKQILLLQSGQSKQDAARDRSLLTHEFVHALQDQHFNLLELLLARPYNFDRSEAAFALVEGDAMNVQRRQESGEAWARRSLEEIARQEDERFSLYRRGIGAFFPPLLTETFIFRYRDGARFVETLRRSRPNFTTDELFRRPPVSSEQILHPEKYLAGEAPREVAVDEQSFAAEGWQARASSPLGEIGTRGLLMAGLSARDASRAAAGWGGDRAYVFGREGGRQLFVWKSLWDKPEDAQEFFRAYNALVRSRRAVSDTVAASQTSALWREAQSATLIELRGDTVYVVRGAEAELARARELATR